MAMFQDGHDDPKFDQKSTPEVRREMADNNTRIEELSRRLDELEKTVLPREIHDLRNDLSQNDDDLRRAIGRIEESQFPRILVSYVFIRSRFVRFLNFFGCWFIYDSDGDPHPNIPSNECYGRAPLLTRIRRWFI